MNVKKIVVAAVLGIAAATGGAATQESAGTHMDVSCDRAVHEDFNAAVALLHNMTYAQAREGFVSVAERDPSCAMAYWGVAMTLFQPLWPTRPGPSERQQGWDMVRRQSRLGLAHHVPRRGGGFLYGSGGQRLLGANPPLGGGGASRA
jgi:hypothetical protein